MKYLLTNDSIYRKALQDEQPKIIPSAYKVEYNRMTGATSLMSMELSSDNLVVLPETELEEVLKEVMHFFTPETKQEFERLGYLYKKSILLHGKPGTGKTCTIVRIAQYFTDKYPMSYVLYNPAQESIEHLQNHIEKTVPLLVIYEELDDLLERKLSESDFIQILDGIEQRQNVFFLCTTNNIDRIPTRLLRTGRFANVIEVGPLSAIARQSYLQTKLRSNLQRHLKVLVQSTDGFTIDELKHLVVCMNCYGYSVEKTLNIIATRNNLKGKATSSDADELDLYQDESFWEASSDNE